MSVRLPTVSGDSGAWGTVLNNYLGYTHRSTGTHFDNIFNVEDTRYGAVPDAYYVDGTTKSEYTVTNISTAEVVTVSATHDYEVGDYVSFSGTTSTPSLGSTPIYNVTAVTGTTITIGGVDITVGGASGGTIRNHTLRSATAAFVAGDVGKNVVALRAGASTLQDLHTTVSAVPSGTIAVLTDRTMPGRTAVASQTNVRIYLSRSGSQVTQIQAAIDAAAAAGGGIVYLPGVGYLVDNTVTLKHRVTLRGTGKRSTMLHLAGSVNKPVITNDQTLNNTASFCAVEHLWVDGNRQRNTTDFTTTLNGAYTAGGTPVTLTSTTGIQNSGSIMIVNATTKAITGAVASGTQIRITATAHGFTSGDMLTLTSVGGVPNANGRWTITVIDANTFDLIGSTFAGSYTSGGTAAWTVFMSYESVSGSTIVTASGGTEGSTDHNLATGSAVTQFQNHGIVWIMNPFNTTPTLGEVYDPFHRVEDVLIKNCHGDGYGSWGQAENRVINSHAELTDQFGFRVGFDHWMLADTASYAGRAGFYTRYSGPHMVQCKAWYCGNTPQEGYGFFLEGPVTIEEGTKILAGCHAQDNKANGFYFRTAQRIIAQIMVSSNGTSSIGTYAGIKIDGCTNGVIDAVCTERVASPNNAQQNAIEVLNTAVTSTGLQIRLTHGAAAGSTVGAAVKTGSGLTGGINLLVNSMGGKTVVAPAAAGTVTPDPYVATQYRVLMPAGNITIANPANAHEGTELEITIIQPDTTARLVTWSTGTYATSIYKFAGGTAFPTLSSGTAGRRDVFRFKYDATSAIWAEQSRTLNVG